MSSPEQHDKQSSDQEREKSIDLLNQHVEVITEEKIASLAHYMRQRDQEGFTPLLEEGYVSSIFATGGKLVEELQKEAPEDQAVAYGLNIINVILQEFEHVRTSGMISEDSESLKHFGFHLRGLTDELNTLTRETSDLWRKTSDAIAHLRDTTEGCLNVIYQKFTILEGING